MRSKDAQKQLARTSLNGAVTTQNSLGNTKAFLWEYTTSVNGTVSSRMVFP